MNQLTSIFFFVVFSFSSILGQNDSCSYSISGKILDIETKIPIPYASVQVQNTGKRTITNMQGEFFIEELCSNNNTLIISCFGYCDSKCINHHQHGKMRHIYLTQKILELETVTINVEKNKEEGTETISQIALINDEIKIDPTQSLASSIADLQGVSLSSTGTNVQTPVIHGLYGNRILIINNGIKHGFQNWGRHHAPEIDISSANNISIVKGASGVRFGPEALGGAVIVESNPLYLNEPLCAQIGTGFQSNGRGINTSLEIAQGINKWSYFLNGSFTKTGDRHTPEYMLTNSGKEEISGSFGTRYKTENWDFKIYYGYVNQNLALLRSAVAESGNAFVKAINSKEPVFIEPFSYSIGEPNQQTEHHLAKAEIIWWYSNAGKLTLRSGIQLNKRQEFDVRRNAKKPIINLDLMTSDHQLEWKHPDWLKLNGILGFQYFNQDNNNNPGTGTTPIIPNYNTNRFGTFLIESIRFGKNLVELGVRFDYEHNDVRGREINQQIFRDKYSFTNVTSSIGFMRKLSDRSSFRSNFGTAWRTPNMAELFSYGQHGFKTSFGLLRYYTNKNEDLRTDRVVKMTKSGVQPEIGYKFINEYEINKNKTSHILTVYSHYLKNFIFDRPLAVIGTIRGPMPVFIFDQTDALFAGTDYSWKQDWTKHLSGTFGLSYLFSRNISKDEPLINQPPISVSYNLNWNRVLFGKLKSSTLIIKPKYTFKQYQSPRTISPEDLINGSVIITSESENFDFRNAPEGYFLLNISWRFEWKDLSGSISVKNLLNARYRDYLNEMRYFSNEPGRNILFNINYIINGK